jgi:hypothetical protein
VTHRGVTLVTPVTLPPPEIATTFHFHPMASREIVTKVHFVFTRWRRARSSQKYIPFSPDGVARIGYILS